MTWPFENDTSAIVTKLAKRSLQSEKRRNLMVVTAVALAAFLVCFTAITSVSVMQIQRNQVADTYEAVFTGVGESDTAALKDLPEFARVGEYYLLGQEHSEQGYNASYVYCDDEMLYIARSQMELVKGRLPEQADEVAVSEYFLSAYGASARIGETVRLDTESFHGEYTVTGILSGVGEKETNTCIFMLSKAALKNWNGYDPAGYRAYAHFKNDLSWNEEAMISYCKQAAVMYELPVPSMNHSYFKYYAQTWDAGLIAGTAAFVLLGGYTVIQSIFRISINDKIQSYGQLRTIGATSKQIRRIVKKESRKLGIIGILIGTLLGVCGGLLLFPNGFHAAFYGAAILLTAFVCWFMVSISVRRPVKIAAGISPLEAVRFSAGQERIRRRKKRIKLSPVSIGLANFRRDRKKTVSIVASLSLGGILLLVVSSIFLTRSPEQAARLYFPDGDYKIYLASEQSEGELMAAGNPLNEELRQELLSLDGVTDIIERRQAVHAEITKTGNTASGMCDMLTEQNGTEVEQALISGVMPGSAHSILIPSSIAEYYEEMNVGAAVEFAFAQESVSVMISGIYDSKKIPNGHGVLAIDGSSFFAPEELFHELLPEIENFNYSWSIVSDPEKSEDVENGLKDIVFVHSNIGLDTIGIHIEYEKMQSTIIWGGMQVFSWLVFLFGVINLINATLSNQMSRKRENSILRSIGLTRKQLCQINIYEGLCYAFFAALASLLAGLPAAIVICREISKQSFAGEVVPYQFPVLEMGLFILTLFGLEFILSAWTANRQRKQSLIEQMRAME